MSQPPAPTQSAPHSRAYWLSQDTFRLLVAPVAIGFTIGWLGIDNESRLASAGFWSLMWLVNWQANELTSRLLAPVLHRHGISLSILLVFSFVAPTLICVLLNLSFGSEFWRWFGDYDVLEPLVIATPWHMFSSAIAPLFFWLAINLISCRLNEGKLYGLVWTPERRGNHREASRSAPQPQMPAFIEKVRPSLRGTVIAVNAERHYVRVFTVFGDDLIHYRFRDAVAELEPFGGVQVHRSWCIVSSEIETKTGRTIQLRNGMIVPTSRTFRGVLTGQ